MTDIDHSNVVSFIADIIDRRGRESYLGEVVSMREHFLQAADLAERDGASETLIAAALLHDIGHYTSEFSEDSLARGVDNFHENAGAAVLKDFFPPAVVEPVRMHVDAKRYLCAVEPAYFDGLSPASVQSLAAQGGPFDQASATKFEASPWLDDAVRLRRYDDGAKVQGRATPDFDHYVELLERLVVPTT